jgi:hypothetical protein
MNKEFIPYEQALELKELGFDESCIYRYCIVTKWEEPTSEILLQLSDCESLEKNLVKAPLYQQAFRWFREKYELDSSIALVANGYGFYIHKNKNYTNKGENYGMYITYEEAELACLEKLIEIVKNK